MPGGNMTYARAHFAREVIYCEPISLSYPQDKSNVIVPFNVLWSDRDIKLENPANIHGKGNKDRIKQD